MILFKQSALLKNWLTQEKRKGLKTGFVPTMGALHKGHISLIMTSKEVNQITVCSIFVNPTQFNDENDFTKYPITIEKDILLLEEAGCDILFLPSVNEMYPNGTLPMYRYELEKLDTILEGKFRPGHYQGVCMIVHRLLEIVLPDHLYLGQKDFQQCMVISKLIEQIELKKTIKINICPTLREEYGLAMSSRNMRLTLGEQEIANTIFQVLSFIKNNKQRIDPVQLKKEAEKQLEAAGFKVDYVEISDYSTLDPVLNWDQSKRTITLIAAYINEIRLIDNMILE